MNNIEKRVKNIETVLACALTVIADGMDREVPKEAILGLMGDFLDSNASLGSDFYNEKIGFIKE